MKKRLWAACLIFSGCSIAVHAQPYVDPLQVRYTYALRNNHSDATPYQHVWAGSDLPVKLKQNTYLLLSPYYEYWRIDSASKQEQVPAVQAVVLPVGIIAPLNNKWVVSLNLIPRWNGEQANFSSDAFQFGGVAFAGYTKAPDKKLRFGLYMNSDFFGLFVIPLAGTSWKFNDRDFVFGLLPGRLTWEHKLNKHLYTGLTFRAITSSYRLHNGQYVRLDDNQLSAYLDLYATRHICFTLEPGYGIMRKLRLGTEKRTYTTVYNWGVGPFIKLSAAWRMRL